MAEARKSSGDYYPPESLCCGLQRALHTNDRGDVNFFTDSCFNSFRQVLDLHMKFLKSSGNFERKSADIVTEEREQNVLGEDNPQVLDTVFYYVSLYFALRGGKEHRRLHHSPGQIKLYEPPAGLSYLVYTCFQD